MLRSAAFAVLCAVPLLAASSPGAALAKKPGNSYTLACVLRGGCEFVCLAPGAAGHKHERIFEKTNVKTVDFIEFNGAAIATIAVSNQHTTTFRLSGTVFYQMPNSLVR